MTLQKKKLLWVGTNVALNFFYTYDSRICITFVRLSCMRLQSDIFAVFIFPVSYSCSVELNVWKHRSLISSWPILIHLHMESVEASVFIRVVGKTVCLQMLYVYLTNNRIPLIRGHMWYSSCKACLNAPQQLSVTADRKTNWNILAYWRFSTWLCYSLCSGYGRPDEAASMVSVQT